MKIQYMANVCRSSSRDFQLNHYQQCNAYYTKFTHCKQCIKYCDAFTHTQESDVHSNFILFHFIKIILFNAIIINLTLTIKIG